MGNTPSTALWAGAAVSAIALASTLSVTTVAQAAAGDPVATLIDGCGRADRIEVDDTKRDYYVQFPGQTESVTDQVTGKKTTQTITRPMQSVRGGAEWIRSASETAIEAKASKGLAVRVVDEDGTYIPFVIDGVSRGTESFVLTNEDCVAPLAPEFNDEDGTENDWVNIPSVRGVKYSGKPGTNPAKGFVSVTATPEKGFRFADEDGTPLPASDTTWSHNFGAAKTVEVSEDAEPTFRKGATVTVTKGKKTTRETLPNVVVVTHVPGISWVVDGNPVKTSDKQPRLDVPVGTKNSVRVEAIAADPRLYSLDGTTSWTVGLSGRVSTVPVISAPNHLAGMPNGRAGVRWSVPFGVEGDYKYDVQYRSIELKGTRRIVGPWKKWTNESGLKQGTLSGKPGGVYEVRARSVDASGTASAWSRPGRILVPLDITTGPKRTWTVLKDKTAMSGTIVRSTRKGAAWTTRTTATNEITIWYSAGPMGGKAKVYVDGKHRGWIGGFSRVPKPRQVLKVNTTWGNHTVKIVNDSTGRRTQVNLDGIAYSR